MKWGVPFDIITGHTAALTKWREDHLGMVGANNDLQNIGDYVAAVTACALASSSMFCDCQLQWLLKML